MVFVDFDQKICLNYAIIRITRRLLYWTYIGESSRPLARVLAQRGHEAPFVVSQQSQPGRVEVVIAGNGAEQIRVFLPVVQLRIRVGVGELGKKCRQSE